MTIMEENKKGGFSYKIGNSEKFYKALNPNITTTKNGVLYLNADTTIEDNALPDKLVDLYTTSSAVHSNLINLKRNLIIGEGFVPETPSPETLAFLERTNKQGDTWNDMLQKWALDMGIMEAIAIQVIYDSEGQIAAAYHVDASKVRASKPNALGFVSDFFISDSWGDITNKKNRRASTNTRAIKVAAFNPSNWAEDKVQLLYAKRYSMGSSAYAFPSYLPIVPYCELQFELANYNLNKLKKGMLATGMLVLNGDPDDETKRQFIRDYESNYVGSTGKQVLYIWTTSEEAKPDWIPMQTDNADGVFDSLIGISNQAIAIGHGASLELAGIDSKGVSLGGDANKLAVGIAFYNKNIITPMQDVIISAVNKIMKVNGLSKVTIPYVPLDQEISSEAAPADVTEPIVQEAIIKKLNVE